MLWPKKIHTTYNFSSGLSLKYFTSSVVVDRKSVTMTDNQLDDYVTSKQPGAPHFLTSGTLRLVMFT